MTRPYNPISFIPKAPLPAPKLGELHSPTARMLDALQQYRDALAQFRANELTKIGKEKPVKKLAPQAGGYRKAVTDPRFDDF